MHAALRRALADAVRDELVSRNVSLLISPGKAPRERVVPVTDTEARALLAAAADDRVCVLWLVLLSLRLRRGKALALRWSAVDLDGGTLEPRASGRPWSRATSAGAGSVSASGPGSTGIPHPRSAHAAASFLLLQGADLRTVTEQLGREGQRRIGGGVFDRRDERSRAAAGGLLRACETARTHGS
jgi:integrase